MNKRTRAMNSFRIRVHKDAFEGFCSATYDANDSGDLHAKGALYLVYIGFSCWAYVYIGHSYLRRLMASLA